MIPQIVAVKVAGVLSVAGFTGGAAFAYVPGYNAESPFSVPGRPPAPEEEWDVIHAAPPWDLVKDRYARGKEHA